MKNRVRIIVLCAICLLAISVISCSSKSTLSLYSKEYGDCFNKISVGNLVQIENKCIGFTYSFDTDYYGLARDGWISSDVYYASHVRRGSMTPGDSTFIPSIVIKSLPKKSRPDFDVLPFIFDTPELLDAIPYESNIDGCIISFHLITEREDRETYVNVFMSSEHYLLVYLLTTSELVKVDKPQYEYLLGSIVSK